MEPALPAPAEELLAPDTLQSELMLAEIADGTLPDFLNEQRAPKSAARIAAEEKAARMESGAAAHADWKAGQVLPEAEFADQCYYLDPVGNSRRRRRPR